MATEHLYVLRKARAGIRDFGFEISNVGDLRARGRFMSLKLWDSQIETQILHNAIKSTDNSQYHFAAPKHTLAGELT
jgi:hypothetical protein